jgi:hypothetical protein
MRFLHTMLRVRDLAGRFDIVIQIVKELEEASTR